MVSRSMYIWKLDPVISAEGGVNKLIDKARRAKLSAVWVKVAHGASPYRNVTSSMEGSNYAVSEAMRMTRDFKV